MTVPLSSLLASFQRDLRSERRSPNTIRVYSDGITIFIDWLAVNDLPTTLDGLTRTNVRQWLADLAETRSAGTCSTRYRAVRRFCRWLTIEDEIGKDPMAGMVEPASKSQPVHVLTDEQLGDLIKACSGKSFEARRDEAMIRVLLDSGVRVSELLCLTVDGTDLDLASALVRGKGDKVRAVYFSTRTVRALDRYLRVRAGQRWTHLPDLFITQRGRMATSTVRLRLRHLGAQIGVPELHPHMFRHSWAADFLTAGGQERDLKRLAGWSSDKMLERYGAATADARARIAAQRLQRGDRV